MHISNKSLALFLITVTMISILGTIISLNRLSSTNSITGYATLEGNITLSVGSTLSITLDTTIIDYGACVPDSTFDINISSDIANGSILNGGICNGTLPNNISVRNDGNVDANITLNASNTGEVDGGTFLSSSEGTSRIFYKVTNASGTIYEGGCADPSLPINYTAITSNSTTFNVCDNLTNGVFGGSANSVVVDFAITLPTGTQTGDIISFDIEGSAAT